MVHGVGDIDMTARIHRYPCRPVELTITRPGCSPTAQSPAGRAAKNAVVFGVCNVEVASRAVDRDAARAIEATGRCRVAHHDTVCLIIDLVDRSPFHRGWHHPASGGGEADPITGHLGGGVKVPAMNDHQRPVMGCRLAMSRRASRMVGLSRSIMGAGIAFTFPLSNKVK